MVPWESKRRRDIQNSITITLPFRRSDSLIQDFAGGGIENLGPVFEEQKRPFSKLVVKQLKMREDYDPDSTNFINNPNEMMEVLTQHIDKLDRQVKLAREKSHHLKLGM
ncbi:hypothetical protein N7509_014283 [Penicillium cosmopolitanum]|uniref:Uncharacterized protein n=1 Tax=Penicillium cosmopolitanum TaxID=1131564 RepID=A0A9W9V7Z5_9EURO|nr:uncharacterized protein N7509_014283 [Penicillium cosmopolitanum]KAJ5369671.1 hypothetical protein N7509_014283 [Penicillium cosmopolitanum]